MIFGFSLLRYFQRIFSGHCRGGDLYLNDPRYYRRATGDDHVYPTTVCPPASREDRHIE